MIKNVLTIAGSDPSGGAGIQADLKTFSALSCYGMSVVTALTAQNTQGVQGVEFVNPAFVAGQIRSILDDIAVDAIKIGMIGNEETALAVSDVLQGYDDPLVVDPVMVATSGDRLVSAQTVEVLKTSLIPRATIITPNIPEAAVLLGQDVRDQRRAAFDLLSLGPQAVLLKGGHGDQSVCVDILAAGDEILTFDAPRIETQNTHGTGCTLAAALACFLTRGDTLAEAVGAAKAYITGAIKQADRLNVGKGAGPVHHFYEMWRK